MTQDVLWRDVYRAAMLELDPDKLHKRIEAARAAIRLLMEERAISNRDGSGVEDQQLTL